MWRSITPGMPIRCSRAGCQSPYYHVFKKGTSTSYISAHGCIKCAEMWNLLKPEHLIPEPTMNLMRQNWDNMLNALYARFYNEYKAAKKPLSRIPFTSYKDVECSISSLLIKYDLQYLGGKLIDSPEKSIVTIP